MRFIVLKKIVIWPSKKVNEVEVPNYFLAALSIAIGQDMGTVKLREMTMPNILFILITMS